MVCSHVLECRAGNEEGGVQQFPTQCGIYKKHLLTFLLNVGMRKMRVSEEERRDLEGR